MRRIIICCLAALWTFIFVAIPLSNVSGGIVGEEITPDGNTIILDNFDGSTVGSKPSNATTLTYVPSVPGLNQAGNFIQSTYLEYDVNQWSSALTSQGTIEFWIYLYNTEGGRYILDGNWNRSTSYPNAGHVVQIVTAPSSDNMQYLHWNGGPDSCCLPSNSPFPVNQWSHFAASWGTDGTKIYLNGELDIHVPENRHPASPRWIYLKSYLEGGDLGYVDQFHISTIQRTDEEIASRVRYVPDLSSLGFEPPMAGGPVTSKKNRALPLKVQLFDKDGYPISDMDILASPVLQVHFTPVTGGTPTDVTGEAIPAGLGSEGNQFVYVGGKWQFNLKTQNYSAPGTYVITIESGDRLEYDLVSTSTATFVIE